MRNSCCERRDPVNYLGRVQDAGRSTGQDRHVSNVADLTGGFRSGRIGVPEGCSDGQRQNGQQGGNEGQDVDRSSAVDGFAEHFELGPHSAVRFARR